MRWLARLALLVEFALVLECTCRIDDWIRYRMPLWTPVKAKEDLIVIDAEGEHGRPHAQFQSWALNNIGMRGPDVPIPKPPGVIRIVTAGASETFGLYESAGHSYPRLLEDSLRALVRREACPADPPPTIEVLNEAIFGMSLPTMAQDLRLRVAPLKPDIVVVYPTPMYYLAAAMPVRARPDSTGAPTRLPPLGVLYPRAIHRMHDALKSITPRWLAAWARARQDAYDERRLPPNWHFTTIPLDRLAAYDADLRRPGARDARQRVHGRVNRRCLDEPVDPSVSTGHRSHPPGVRLRGRADHHPDRAYLERRARGSRRASAPGTVRARRPVVRRLRPFLGHRGRACRWRSHARGCHHRATQELPAPRYSGRDGPGLSSFHSVAINRRPVTPSDLVLAIHLSGGTMIAGSKSDARRSSGKLAGTIPVSVGPPGKSALTVTPESARS
jgi:hypothetical protein